ncbi:hypothetical protein HF086_005758 [Spodoptera exigua]|uniref:Retrovirus-related Pol polyprotein from transposon TNT 1-94-like beta-barrel domain-containing protein n=1 Tax=Spodoptera exigua TaxID=7107 RepID=A0A922SQX5_SPOEX|nr:hypothetical protein HF086_005758 [Spodoptera exigua]
MSLPAIEKLDGSTDYNTWKFMMELYLIHEDLWEYTQTTPAASDVSGSKRDQKARAKICLMIKPHCLIHVRESKTAKAAWDALMTAFEDKGLNNRCRLLTKLVSLKLEQFSSIRDYITAIMTVAQQLRDLGKKVDDELLAALMLQGLTETFQPMRLAIENTNIELTTDYVKTKLLQMEDTYQASPSTVTTALQAKNKSQKDKSHKNMSRSRVVKCFICKENHKAKDCPKNPIQKKDALTSLALATAAQGHGEWILDSGASNHMTNRRDWLKDFKKLDKSIVIACANGETVVGEAIGNVVNEDMDVSINNVLYVPNLATNLLSVSTIVNKNLVVVFEKSGFKIIKADGCKVSGETLYEGTANNGVYKIQYCSQEVGLASTAADYK